MFFLMISPIVIGFGVRWFLYQVAHNLGGQH